MYISSKIILFNNFEFSNQTSRKKININLNLCSQKNNCLTRSGYIYTTNI